MVRCPGQDKRYWDYDDIYTVRCPYCGNEMEFFKDEPKLRCRVCKQVVRNPKLDLGCAEWCPFAEYCVGVIVKEGLGGSGMELRGSKTERNLLTAFVGESQARNRYSYFASQAKKDGFVKVQAIFEETANQEKEHAKRLFKFLKGGEVEVSAVFPAGVIGSTLENLRAAADGERYEHSEMYPEFAKVAKEEGFDEIAEVFSSIAVAERYHEERYRAFIKKIEEGTMFRASGAVKWRCRNCGYIHEGEEAPEECPACAHPRDYFELFGEYW